MNNTISLKFPIGSYVIIKKHPFTPDTVGRIISYDGEKYNVEFSTCHCFFNYQFEEADISLLSTVAIVKSNI